MRMGNLWSNRKTSYVDSSDGQDSVYEEPSLSLSAQAAEDSVTSSQSTDRPTFVVRTDNVTTAVAGEQAYSLEEPSLSSSAQSSVTSSQSTERPTFVVRTDNVTSTVTGEQDKTSLLVNALKRRYRTQYDAIQPIPYIKERLYCVDKVFVEGGTEFYSVRGTSDKGEWVRVNSYRDIFTDSRIKSTRRIIEAQAGYSKSTVTLQLAYDWCNGVEGSPLKDVEILILLRLRQLGNVKSIYKAIKMFLLADEPRIISSDIKNIIESCPSVEVLLDGYDEYPDKDKRTGSDVDRIITNDLFEDFDVSLTTRYLPKYYDRFNTKRVRLVGFDEKARDQYIRKAIAGDDEDMFEEIKRALKAYPILDDLCQVPIFFVMFAHMTQEKEKEYFQTFKSVTEFFRHMIQCFHDHIRNKSLDQNTKKHMSEYEIEHTELSNVALEGLTNENQQLSWGKENLGKRLGQEFYDHYISVGILVEEDAAYVTNEMTAADNIRTKTEARFYHKLFCEYFASFALVIKVAAANNATEVKKILDKIDPFNFQYLYRFSCGIDATVGSKIIEYLKGREDGDKFAILCILEQAGEIDDSIKESVREICSKPFILSNGDSKLLERSSIQLLDIASKCDIPNVDLCLVDSFSKADKDNIVLRSGLSLGNLSTAVKLKLYTELGRELTEEDVIGLLKYAEQSKGLRELWFIKCPLPETVNPNSIPIRLKTSNLQVVWQNSGRCLDLHSGQWIKVDDVDTITKLCSSFVTIDYSNSVSQQRSTIELLEKASRHDILITILYLQYSFSHMVNGDVILQSGLRLPRLSSVYDMLIETFEGIEMTQQEVVDILMYVQQSYRLNSLSLYNCLLPRSIPVQSIPSYWISKDIKVQWSPRVTDDSDYVLDLRTGAWWQNDVRLTWFEYRRLVKRFRDKYAVIVMLRKAERDQQNKNRTTSEGK